MKKLVKGLQLRNRGHKSSYARHCKRPYDYGPMYRRLEEEHPESPLAEHRAGRKVEG